MRATVRSAWYRRALVDSEHDREGLRANLLRVRVGVRGRLGVGIRIKVRVGVGATVRALKEASGGRAQGALVGGMRDRIVLS